LAARDVIASWEMIVNADFPAPIRTGWDQIAAINAPDARTVVVKTRQPYGPFFSNIAAGAFNCSAIAPAEVLNQGARAFSKIKTPIGSGPFKVASWSSSLVELERFTAHWAGAPSIARLSVRAYADDDALLAALEKGEIQIAHRIGAPGKSRVKDAAALPNVSVLGFPGNAWAHLDLKQIDLLQNRAVRQALDHATPTDEIIATILNGEAVRAYADQEPGSWAFQNAGKPRAYSLDRARELLQVAGLRAGKDGVLAKNGVELAIELWGDKADPTAKPILNLIAKRWSEIGVRATVHLDSAQTIWGAGGYQFTKKMTAGFFRWTNYNDPDDRYYWHSSSIPAKPGGPGGNAPAFFHPYGFQAQIDDLTTRAAVETDQARRKALYWQIQDLLANEVPVIFLFWDLRYAGCAANLSGFWPSSFTSLLWNARDWQPTQQ
jgi:peptide/nickel transport system substrate-binding protein